MEVLIILAIILIKLGIEGAQRKRADDFCRWMDANGPHRYLTQKEMQSWKNLYEYSKHR